MSLNKWVTAVVATGVLVGGIGVVREAPASAASIRPNGCAPDHGYSFLGKLATLTGTVGRRRV